ncbi:MAG: M14 family metallopeptidase [Pyrinomonadaceae bacterium]|nr:M14 family metallopeptidase [Pyrinomonadaceae bacterium]
MLNRIASLLLLLLIVSSVGLSQSESANVPPEWQTAAEKTNYAKTSRYDEAIKYAKELDKASDLISYQSIGKSGEGRDIPMLIAARDGAFSPKWAKKTGRAIVFIQAGIHAGEIDGKDAGFALLRDIAITKTRLDLLKEAIIIFIPIYSVDGHENWSAYNRINQNGPDEMGYRANSNNLNLNRDYMKADAPETRAWLKLWNDWKPDLFIDCHVTNGADFQYNVTYEYAHFQEVHPAIKLWMDEHFDGIVVPKVEKEGNLLTHYVEFAGREVTGGVATFIATPRFATGYTPIRNRPGLLIETNVYKSYKSRVRGTYDVLWKLVEEAGAAKASLFVANITADTQTVERGKTYDEKRQFPLSLTIDREKSTPLAFKGVEYKTEASTISGGNRLIYTDVPMNITIPRFDESKVSTSVAPPLYYIIPPQYAGAIDLLTLHGIKFTRLAKPLTTEVESYKLTEPKWATSSFENRITLTAKQTPVKETRSFIAGSALVALDQEAASVAIHLLEPNGPDSLFYWGYFNSIFEQKEGGSGYVLEKLAREMLAKDPKLQEEFDKRLLDPAFARSPQARLRFFYERSPYYLNQKIGVYPVGRVLKAIEIK